MKLLNASWITLSFSFACMAQANSFSVDGNSVQNIVSAKVKGEAVLYISELDGGVSCYTVDGKKLWRNPTETPAVMLEIEAADVDGDGRDELLAASADGNIYCWNSDGSLRWRFNPGTRFTVIP